MTLVNPSTIQKRYVYTLITMVFVWGLALSGSALAQPKQLNVSNIRFKHVLANHDVALGAMLTTIQDSQGFIWFGGIGGLARYDGYDLHIVGDTLNASESIKSVHDLAESGDTLWVATSYGLIKFDKRTESFTRYSTDKASEIPLSQNYINKVAALPNGNVVLATYGGFDVIDLESKEVKTLVPEGANSHFVFALKVDTKKSRLWLGSSAGLYAYYWKTGKVKPLVTKTPLDNASIHAIDFGAKNSLWLGTDKGLFNVSANGKVQSRFSHEADNVHSLGANLIWSVLYDDGYVWAGTDQGGVSIFDERLATMTRLTSNIASPTSLATNTIKSIFKDGGGGVWLGNFPEGMHYFNKETTVATLYKTNPMEKSALNHNSIMAFSGASDKGLWVGTDGGGLNYLDLKTQTFKSYVYSNDDNNTLRSNAVLALLNDSQGRLWTGTWGGGLARFDPKKDKVIPITLRHTDDGSEERFNVWSLYEDSTGIIWVGTQTKGLLRWRESDNSLIQYMPSDDPASIAGEAIWSMMEDASGNFWISTNHGLNILNRNTGQFTRFRHDANDQSTLAHNSVESMFEDSKGRLWFGSVGGLNLFQPKEKSFKRITRTEGLVSDSIKSIVEDDLGNLWVGTANGISKIDGQTLSVKNYRPHIGWQKGSFNVGAAYKASDGTLYFGGPNGFMAFKPQELVDSENTPPIVITDLRIETDLQSPNSKGSVLSQTLPFTDRVTIPSSAQMFTIHYSALDYSRLKANAYRYKLEGFDSDWREVGSYRYATYTNLAAGEYRFIVEVKDLQGQWSEAGAQLLIYIK